MKKKNYHVRKSVLNYMKFNILFRFCYNNNEKTVLEKHYIKLYFPYSLIWFLLPWKKSKRYNQNPIDIPLSSNGHIICYNAIKNILNNYNGNFGFIYSSPLTRCIQTSLEFQKYIESTYSIKILIRIEYGLLPNFFGDTDTLYFLYSEKNKNDRIIKFKNNKLQIIKPYTYIDDYLSFDNITKRYGKKNFDFDYKAIYTQEKINSQHNLHP